MRLTPNNKQIIFEYAQCLYYKAIKDKDYAAILIYYHHYKIPLDEDVFRIAIFNDDLRMLKILKKINCPYPKNAFQLSKKYSNFQISNWLSRNYIISKKDQNWLDYTINKYSYILHEYNDV